MGSGTVLIGCMPAARLFDKTAHGGSIVFGAGTVLIGDFAAIGSRKVFPGRQHYGNCGIQSSKQIIHQATGANPNEDVILSVALSGGYAENNIINSKRGSTGATGRQGLLQEYNVSSIVIDKPNKDDLAAALKEDKGIIANVDAGKLWNDPEYVGSGHAIVIIEGDFNEKGELTHVYINDTGTAQQGRRLSINDMLEAMRARQNDKGISSYQINVTTDPIWNHVR